MPQQSAFPNGAPCWMDLASSDPDKSIDFYGRLFGWSYQQAGEDYGGYITFSSGGRLIAGMVAKDPASGDPDGWSMYLATDDIEDTAKASSSNGGRTLMNPKRLGDLGRMAILCDAGGAAIGAWQAGIHKGFGFTGKPGSPVWHELSTRDYNAAVEYYQQVFGWKTEVMSDTDDFRYTTLGSGDGAKAGIFDAGSVLPSDVPASWQVYMGVNDVDASVTLVQKLGGTVQRSPWDSDYGRMAQVTDSTGAVFVLASV